MPPQKQLFQNAFHIASRALIMLQQDREEAEKGGWQKLALFSNASLLLRDVFYDFGSDGFVQHAFVASGTVNQYMSNKFLLEGGEGVMHTLGWSSHLKDDELNMLYNKIIAISPIVSWAWILAPSH